MASALFGLLAVQLFVSGVVAHPRCSHAPPVSSTISWAQPSSTESSSTESSTSTSVELSSSTESESVASSTVISSESTLAVPTSFSSDSESVIPSSSDSSPASSTALPSSTLVFSPTTTAPYCDPTPTYLPEYCWASIPSQCSSLNRTPTIPYPVASVTATACRSVFSANGALATAVADCFVSIGRPQFNPTSAYSCISAASLYCQSTTASCDPFATPTATPINGGFESGDLSSWVRTQLITSPANNIDASVTSERSHSGGKSLKVTFQNLDGALVRWEQAVKLVPGANYELSYWWYSANSQAYSGTTFGLTSPGMIVSIRQNTDTGPPANQWNRASATFVAPASFGTLFVSFSANKGPTGNTVYIDDIGVNLVS